MAPTWHLRGSYFESCNCEAICPCRMIGGIKGGRSTYGICFGVLSWLVEDGAAGETDLSGLAVALVIRYDDDEPRSPWSFIVHVDERGSSEQRDALARIMTGELGGDDVLRLPWNSKPSKLLSIEIGPIEISKSGGEHRLRIGPAVVADRKSPGGDGGSRRVWAFPATTSPGPSSTPTSSSSTTGRSPGSYLGTPPS